MNRYLINKSLSIILILIASGASDQSLKSQALTDRPAAHAEELSDGPNIDGEVLNDPIWSNVQSFGELTQVQPHAGESASEKTDIRIGFDDKRLYVSVVCYDKTPEDVVVTDARRDGNLEATDAFLMILDTYHNGQDGFVFGTNSVGTQYDAQVDNEGQGNFNNNRQQGGTIGGFNINWDASWDVASKVGDYGWSAEFAIPFKTIRFSPGENQTWGINFQRNIQKTNETAFWAPLPINFNLYRLSMAGDLEGLNLKKPGNLKVIPYALGIKENSTLKDESGLVDAILPNNTDGEVGIDLKYSITPSITLDLTYNTDFAQVEVDDQQVNLDRFNLFFPEKRPFFLENAGLFSVGSPGEVDLFFSRRIGIGAEGTQVPIIGGARISGRINNTNIGLLSMFTEDIGSSISANAFTVARVDHQLSSRSSIGGLFVNRSNTTGDQLNDTNSTYAIDGNWGIGKQAQISGFFSKTNTPDVSSGDHSYQIKGSYDWNNWIMRLAYTEVGNGFNPEVGFLGRKAFKKPEVLVLYKWRLPEASPFLEFRPHVSWRGYWNFDGVMETGFLHIDNHWEWKSGTELHTGINFTKEGVVADFNIAKDIVVPAGTYDHSEVQFVFFTNPSKPISISSRHTRGGFFGGDRFSNSASLAIRIGDKLTSEFGLSHNDINLPSGDFTTDVFRSKISYSFTPNIFLQALLQRNSVTDQWSSNVRFGWLGQSNSGLFLVYNETRGDFFAGGRNPFEPRDVTISNRNFIIKFSKLFDVLK